MYIATKQDWEIEQRDVAATYLQAPGFDHEVAVKSLKEDSDCTVFWSVTAAVYGLADSGRLWYITSDNVLTAPFRLKRSEFESTLYSKKQPTSQLLEFNSVSKVANYLYCDSPDATRSFKNFLQKIFGIGELGRHLFIAFGCEIGQIPDWFIVDTHFTKANSITMACVQTHRPDKEAVPASLKNLEAFWRVPNQMLYLSRTTNPTLLFHASAVATKTSDFHVSHLMDIYLVLSSASPTVPTLSSKSIGEEGRFTLNGYCDDSLEKGFTDTFDGRLGCIIFSNCEDIVHASHWGAHKLHRVARSPATTKILAAAKTTNVLL